MFALNNNLGLILSILYMNNVGVRLTGPITHNNSTHYAWVIRMSCLLKQHCPIYLMDSISSCNDRRESSRIPNQTVMSHVYYICGLLKPYASSQSVEIADSSLGVLGGNQQSLRSSITTYSRFAPGRHPDWIIETSRPNNRNVKTK